jgi:hypothetical protein
MFLSRSSLWFVGAALLCLTGCDVAITSSLPSVVDDRIVGEWRGPNELGKGTKKTQTYQVHRSGDHYEIGDADDILRGSASKFSLAKVGKFMLIQDAGDRPEGYSACGKIPNTKETCRCLLGVVEIGQDRCVFRMFDATRILDVSSPKTIGFVAGMMTAHLDSQGKLEAYLLFDGRNPSALAEYLGTYIAAHPKNFKKPDTFVRLQ